MGSNRMAADSKAPNGAAMTKLLEPYGCGPIRFSGADEALYEAHRAGRNRGLPAKAPAPAPAPGAPAPGPKAPRP